MISERRNERGGASLKFLLVMLIIGSGVYAGYLYIPVAYQAYVLKDLMQHTVDVCASQGYPPSWAGNQLLKSAAEYQIPPNAVITPMQNDNRVEVRVQFTRTVEFPGYVHNYEFDYTARSTALLSFK